MGIDHEWTRIFTNEEGREWEGWAGGGVGGLFAGGDFWGD